MGGVEMKHITGGSAKSEHNACPICGLPRGKGPHEFAHGKCAEERAKTEGKKRVYPGHKTLGNLKLESIEKAKDNKTRKRYTEGKLPKWMYS
jgi:hypothetical protein